MSNKFIAIGAVNALLAVAMGAFGAHGLRAQLTERMLEVFQTGVQYHAMHALGLILIGVLCRQSPRSAALVGSGWALLAGIVLFSGSLYLLAVTGISRLGMITPLGGSAFLLGWGLLAWGTARE